MSIADRSLSAAVWNYAGTVSRLGLQFVIGIVLARLLGPEVFGVVAILMLLIGIGQLFSDFGLSSALVQAREITAAEVSAVSGWQIALGLLLTALTAGGAVPIAAFFGSPEAVVPIRAIACVFLIRSLGQTPTALLTRQMRFKAMQGMTISAYVVGYVVVGLSMAFVGYGVWSLVAAQIVQTVIASAAAIILAGGIARPSLSVANKPMFAFGFRVISANVANWLLSNLDTLVVGHVFNAATLGFYNRAYTLAGSVTSAMTSSLQPVLFAAVSRVQDKKVEIAQAMLACMQLFLLTAGVILMVTAATAPTVVEFFYGRAWLPAGALLAPLALALALHGVLAFFGPTLMALGHVEREVRAQWIGLALMTIIVLIAAGISAQAIAWGVVAAFLLRFLLLLRQMQAVLDLPAGTVATALAIPLIVCGAAVAAALLAQAVAGGASVLLRTLAITIASAMAALSAAAMLRFTLAASPLGKMIGRSARFSALAGRWQRG